MENLVKLLAVLAWPITVLFILIIFRRQIIGITDLIQRVEAPGGFKLYLDREKVEQIIKKGTKENVPVEELASQIVAEVVDTLELRVL